MATLYPTAQSIISTHAKTIESSGGGLQGIRDNGLLESTLEHIQNDDYYPSLEDKLTHLFYSLAASQIFLDGNKRIAIAATALMLLLNGYMSITEKFIRDMENISEQVGTGIIDKDLLHEVICAHVRFEPDNEQVKLKILEAISAAQEPRD